MGVETRDDTPNRETRPMTTKTKAPLTHYNPKNVDGNLAERIRREIAELQAMKAAGQWDEALEKQYRFVVSRRMFYGM